MPLEWNADELSLLRFMWADGSTGEQIADVMGSTRSAILGKVNRLGLVRPGGFNRKPGMRARRKPKPRPVFPFIDRKPAIVWGPVLIWDLEPRHCRWIAGDPATLLYCGQERLAASPYCRQHTGAAFHYRRAA